MNRTSYKALRRCIRDNGLRYTAHNAVNTGDMVALQFCDDIANIIKLTDWLAMRENFAKSEKPAIAFKLTTKFKDIHNHTFVWGSYTWNSGNRDTSFI